MYRPRSAAAVCAPARPPPALAGIAHESLALPSGEDHFCPPKASAEPQRRSGMFYFTLTNVGGIACDADILLVGGCRVKAPRNSSLWI